MIQLMEQEIFNERAMKRIAHKMQNRSKRNETERIEERKQLTEKLTATQDARTNIANAIAEGLAISTLVDKLHQLEEQKVQTEALLARLDTPEVETIVSIDPALIPAQYRQLKLSGNALEYREFVQSFLDKVIVGRYSVTITLNTGLDVAPEQNLQVTVRRPEMYENEKDR